MAKRTQRECIIATLEARGERLVPDPRLSKYVKYTRTYLGKRDVVTGALVPARGYWFISVGGAMRVGQSSTKSLRVGKSARAALIEEGRNLLTLRRRTAA